MRLIMIPQKPMKIIKVTTEANADEFNEVNEDEVRQFSLELGAGPKRMKLVRESSGSAPPVFRRMAGGQSLEEVMAGLAEEAGLDKFSDIVDHFLGRITVEKIES